MPAQNYVLLERIELNASAASVTFSNIPQSGYTDLKVVLSARDGVSSVIDGARVRFNNDTTSGNYTARRLIGSGSAASSDTNNVGAFAVGNTATASTFSNCEFYIPNYTGSTAKSVSFDNVAETNATTQYMGLGAFLWSGTAAITTITISGESADFLQYSTFSLYGLAAHLTTPTIAPKASGGNIIDFDGTYWIHTFLTTGAFVPAVGLTCDALVVAGGGAGGGYAGGGGAGGLIYATSASVTTTSYTVTVGAGGAGVTANTATKGADGNNSIFSSYTAGAGGGGGADTYVHAGNGAATNGNGGGGGYGSNAGTGNGSGFAGGVGNGYPGNTVANYSSGGGGGAGGGGSNATAQNGGNGGAGAANSITGTSVTYAGGGGGGNGNGASGSGGTGGSGGGGNGNKWNSGGTTSGTINTGGGGGGNSQSGTSGAGGSGIVIIRYLAA